jgi:hypothetical protein
MTGNEHRVCATYLHNLQLLWWLYSSFLEGMPINDLKEWLCSDVVDPAVTTQPCGRILEQKLEIEANN